MGEYDYSFNSKNTNPTLIENEEKRIVECLIGESNKSLTLTQTEKFNKKYGL